MAPDDFYRGVIEKLDHLPFEPFAIEMNDGRRIEFNRPSIAIRGGAAGGFDKNGKLILFDSDQVKQIVHSPPIFQSNSDRI